MTETEIILKQPEPDILMTQRGDKIKLLDAHDDYNSHIWIIALNGQGKYCLTSLKDGTCLNGSHSEVTYLMDEVRKKYKFKIISKLEIKEI